MGGNAFHQLLPHTNFPRLPPTIYYALKARLLPRLYLFYENVTVPAEAPEKVDYGDLDFVVAGPKSAEMSHEDVKNALGADFVIPFAATSHYAVPITQEWLTHSHLEPIVADGENVIYCQVDVHACADKEEWELIRFMHGYGDVGMILGLIARNYGFSLGTSGLKILVKTANPPFHLTSSVPSILDFLGLSLDTWEKGFTTERAVFEWATTSRFFSVHKLGNAHSKKRRTALRAMYSRFVEWTQEQPVSEKIVPSSEAAIAEALSRYGRKAEYDALMEEYARVANLTEGRKLLKVMFNGTLVGEWTGLDNRRVKIVMDRVRQDKGGEAGLLEMDESHIRLAVEAATIALGFHVT